MGLTHIALSQDARGVATYTFDDDRTRNALSTAVLVDIDETLGTLAGDASVRVVVFTGAGNTFSSGADRAELGDPATIERTTALLGSILVRIESSPVPVVCRVNGAAFGAGLAIVAAADIALATADATFGLPEVRFGLVAGPAAAACLARMGEGAGLDLLLTGRRFGAHEAERLHLVTAVIERQGLDAAIEERIADLLLGDYDALAATRRVVHRMSGMPMTERLRIVQEEADAENERFDGYITRGVARDGVRDVDWRDVPARPRRALPTSEVHPDLQGELHPLGRCVVALGTFDGMHRGHAEVVQRAVASAERLGLPSVLLTFDPHPDELTRPGTHPAVLTTIARRAELAAAMGMDVFRVVPFDQEVAHLEPADFVRRALIERLHVAEVVVGTNFRFGHRAAGSVANLSELAERLRFSVSAVEMVRHPDAAWGDRVVSATAIRSCIEAGDVELGRSGLGRPHRLDGVIEHGDHRGRTLGFPTANLSFDRFAAIPADGVYGGSAVFLDEWGQTDTSLPLGSAAISIGTNPTFDGRQRRVEAHILDWDQDLYGRRVGLEFDRRLRGMIRFDDIAALVDQMGQDVEDTRVG